MFSTEDPEEGDWEQIVTNSFGRMAAQDYPANVMFDYFAGIIYEDDVMIPFGHDPVQYLSRLIKMEKMTSMELAVRDNTEPSEDMRRDIFWRSFSPEARHWVDQVDLGGTNDYVNMTRFQIGKRMRAFYLPKVEEARKRLGNKSNDNDKHGNYSDTDN